MLERGCLYAFASRPKVGKTIMLSNLAAAVSRGRDWLGRQVTPGRVYFFQLEDSDRTLKKRLERMLGPDSPPDLLFHVSPFRLCEENYDLTLSQVKGASLIICDPIIQATEVRDWNSQAEVREAYEFWRQLARDTDAAVCVSNHHRKMEGGYGDQMAGSIQALATVDGVIELYRDPKLQKSERKVSFVGRDWSDLPDEVVALDVETLTWLFKGQLGEVIEQEKEDKRDEDAQRALTVLPGSPPGITLQDWEEDSGLSSKRLKVARNALDGQVASEGSGVKGSPLKFWREVID